MTGKHSAAQLDAAVTRSGSDVYTSADCGQDTATDGRSDGRAVADPVAGSWPHKWPRPERPTPDTIAATAVWLDREIKAGRGAATAEVPLFGTAAWAALPDSEPAKWVALFQVARAWFAEYVSIPQRNARELAEERARFEAWAAERDRADYALFRRFALETADGIERRERRQRHAASAVLPNRTGPELIAAARASWAWLDGPTPQSTTAGSSPNSVEAA